MLDISPSGFYAWVKRPPSRRTQANAALLEEIWRIHGDRVRHKRLLRADGLQSITWRKFHTTTRRDLRSRRAADLVERASRRLDRICCGSPTSRTSRLLYLAILLDVFSRRIVGWAMQTTLEELWRCSTRNMAIAQRQPETVIHHSDHGCHSSSVQFGKRC